MKRTDHRHHHMLVQKLGAREAREFWFRCELAYPCDFCGAGRSEQCHTAAGLAVPYTHSARSAAARDFCHQSLWEATNADVEEAEQKRAAEAAEMARHEPRLRPRIRIEYEVDELDGIREELRLLRLAIRHLVPRSDAEPTNEPAHLAPEGLRGVAASMAGAFVKERP